jgi:hypothetical protein
MVLVEGNATVREFGKAFLNSFRRMAQSGGVIRIIFSQRIGC